MSRTRREFLGWTVSGVGALAAGSLLPRTWAAPSASVNRSPNVLFIAIDDLNDWVGCLGGHSDAKTPNIDRLAARGRLFTHAYAAAPSCTPSRVSVMSSVRPSRSGVYLNRNDWQPVLPDHVMLPSHFMANGYEVVEGGKVFPGGGGALRHKAIGGGHGPAPPGDAVHYMTPAAEAAERRFARWWAADEPDDAFSETRLANNAAEYLKQPHENPFFLSVGFERPHTPLFAPKKYFDMYPPEEVALPKIPDDEFADLPRRPRRWVPHDFFEDIRRAGNWREVVAAYLACVSYVDANIGRLIDAVDQSPHADNTIIVLWSDHGYHLGEKAKLGKATLWEEATRVPLIIAGPNVPAPGAACARPVSLIDIYPTLVDLCGASSAPSKLDGVSLRPLVENPDAEWTRPAVMTRGRNHHAVRTERWRYINYNQKGEELYDHRNDPHESHNLAEEPGYAHIKTRLRQHLPAYDAKEAPRL